MSRKPDAMDLLAMARPASLDRGSRVSADDMLLMATAEAPGESSRGPSRPGPTPSRPRLWALWAPLATAAIVVLVFALVTNLASAPAVLDPPRTNQELFDLADRIEKLPAESGAYWREATIHGGHVSSDGYGIMLVERIEIWQPRDPADPVLTKLWEPGARPATARDERAWRAAGAPARVKAFCRNGGRCSRIPIVDEPKGCQYSLKVDSKDVHPEEKAGMLTMADLAALPTDPAGLVERLRAYHESRKGPGLMEQPFEKSLPITARYLLGTSLTPAQRAAVIRVLAGLPTVKVVGTVTDPLGRKGLSVDLGESGDYGQLPAYYRQILDPGTGRTLSSVTYASRTVSGVTKGEVVNYSARGPESGWTGPPPSSPKGCKKEGR
ncbi:CU044_5270 family protein [Streptosporangium sp. NPDC023963]|uniref:CU044_5270 family protein n=1 Tax=Streptosporangium sp. NPDC023963 TaxID=3155608 RepID=UPI00343EF48D